MLHASGADSAFSAELVIRKATVADASGVLECLRDAFNPYRSSYTPEAFRDTVLSPETYQQRLSSMCIFVAVDENRLVVGTIACRLVSAEQGHLRGMAVRPEFQGRGLALKLLQSAEAELAEQGCSRITLNTTGPLQRAMRFYEKHGYRPTGRTRDYFGMTLHEYVKQLSV